MKKQANNYKDIDMEFDATLKPKRITHKDLEKKHPNDKVRYVSIAYQRGDLIDSIIMKLCQTLSMGKGAVVKNALLSYNLFINQSMKEQKVTQNE